jgi:hypothetical protein
MAAVAGAAGGIEDAFAVFARGGQVGQLGAVDHHGIDAGWFARRQGIGIGQGIARIGGAGIARC